MTQEIENQLVEALENIVVEFQDKLSTPIFMIVCIKRLTEIAYKCAPCESEARSLILEAMLCAKTTEPPQEAK